MQHSEAPWARSRMYLSNSSLEWKLGDESADVVEPSKE